MLRLNVMRTALACVVTMTIGHGLVACSDDDQQMRTRRGSARERSSANGDGGAGTLEEESTGTAPDTLPDPSSQPMPKLRSLAERCKLISDRNLDDPTANDTHFRANLRGTDLGIPVAHANDLYFFFGDTAGVRGIWALGPESLPDAVGVASYSAVKSDPSTLCSNLRFLGGSPESSVGRAQDSRIARDFAGAWMTPPEGHSIGEYIRNPSGPRGKGAWPNMPGDFEVPSGAFSHQGSIYVFYTTVESPSVVEMKGAYLARWTSPSATGLPAYEILYSVDQRFDDSGPLRGDFINIAPLVVDDYLYVYGSGKYRQSSVHLARKPLSALATPGGFERFDADTMTWRAANDASAKPIVASPTVGELSVRYFPAVNRFVMMNQEINGSGNQVVVRFAKSPEGPWSAPTAIASFSDPAFLATYCCVNGVCSGKRLFNCDRAGFYGTYMLPDATKNADGSFTIDFTMSTWDPYNVALMSATFE
ncbi:MAG: hypothetical protein BGO98_26110 [Myxococcales bacterium 68-20]|nr:MAG: hypothetical protein BGO98_26110 [Myxococcales bacterium 68-20]